MILALVLVLVFGYLIYYFVSSDEGSVSEVVFQPTYQAVGSDILEAADKLRTVSIESSLFAATLFTNLKDFSVSLLPENQGRVNPFDIIE